MWITFGINKSINHRDKLYQIFKMTDPDTYNIIFKSSIPFKRNNTMKPASINIKIILNKIGNKISELIGKTKQKKHFPQFFQNENGVHITDKLEIANKFNNVFVDIGKKLANNPVNDGQKTFTDFLTKLNFIQTLIL